MYPRAARQHRFWSSEEKRRMVAESFTPGASRPKWRSATASTPICCSPGGVRREGATQSAALQLLPVTDADAGTAAGAEATQSQVGRMEIVLNSGERILVGADVDESSLARVVKALFAAMIPVPSGVRVWRRACADPRRAVGAKGERSARGACRSRPDPRSSNRLQRRGADREG
jgi:hypothetical protein